MRGLDDDEILLLVGLFVVAVVLGIVNPAGIRDAAVAWLLQHHILVQTSAAVLSLGDGVGVGSAGVVLVVSLFVLAGVLAYRSRRKTREPQ